MTTAPDTALADDVEHLLEAIYARYQQDFRGYARASLRRRVRHAAEALGASSVAELERLVVADPVAFAALLRSLTVQVSDMFRDAEYFAVLRERIAPILATYPSLKIWIAGCSTGEEVYSLAIVLREEGLLARSLLYATDIAPEALRAAEAGVYDAARLRSFAERYRKGGGKASLLDYCRIAYDRAIFDRTLASSVVFSDHSLATDQVFAEVQLVSCRNVFIYFDRELQDRAVGLFHESLCRRGFLGLGARETLRFGAHAASFTEFSARERWYQRR